MRNAKGLLWQYKNDPARGVTWAAELRVGNAILCVHGQKLAKSAIAIANKAAAKLGWTMRESWERIENKRVTRGMLKRRTLA